MRRFHAFTRNQSGSAARGSMLEASYALDEAESAAEDGDCRTAFDALRKYTFLRSEASAHLDSATREPNPISGSYNAELEDQSGRLYDFAKAVRAQFQQRCILGGVTPARRAEPEPEPEAPPAPKAKKAKAPKRLQTQKTDWLAPPTVPGEPEPFPTDVEEAIEAIQEAEAEGPRITITPARDEDGPDVAARAKLIPGEGTWAEGKKRSRKARAAREVPDELPPLTPEALAPPRKRGPRGNTRSLEYTSKSGKVCRIKISSTPNGCLLVED